jgi:hypothetical protein
MAANTSPIYIGKPNVQIAGSVIGPSANTATDGTGANISLIYTFNVTEGGFANKIIMKPIGATAATVARVFLCTDTGATFTPGTTNTTANTALIAEISLPAITVSQTAAQNHFEIPLNIAVQAGVTTGMKLLMTFGTSTGAAGVGYNPVTIGGSYSNA